MAEALAVPAALSLLKATVGLLATELVKEVGSPVWNQTKTASLLEDAILRLKPVVSGISPSTANDGVRTWLEHLETRLEAVKEILTAHNNVNWYSGLNRCKMSKKLVQETELLHLLLQEASLPVLSSSLASQEVLGQIREQVDGMRQEVQEQRRDFGQIIRAVLNPITTHPCCGLRASEAISQIMDHADSIINASSGNGEGLEFQPAPCPRRGALRRQDSLTVFGGDEVVGRAKELLISEKVESHWVGLCAAGGAGKTLAAQRIFNNVDIQAHFTGGCFWLTLGNSKSIMSLLRELEESMVRKCTGARNVDMVELKNFLSNELCNRKQMLLVLDDVWDDKVLTWLDVLPREAGCKVLVTTRDQQVLDKRHADRLDVQLLSEANGWKLFCWHACRGIDRMPLELIGIAKQIASECKRLPLALKVIGGSLAGKTDVSFWKLTYAKLKNADVLSPDHEEQLYLRLKVSVDELEKIDARLKDCFFYFAAFPEDYEVDVEHDLFPLWLGDGIVGKQAKYDPMDEACELLGWLISRSLIEVHSPDWPGFRCKVHDVLRDLGRYMLQHNIAVEKRDCLYEAGMDLRRFPPECVPSPACGDVKMKLSARRMSLMSSQVDDVPCDILEAPKLEVLVLRNNPIKALPCSLFEHNLGNLKVLDLSGTSITILPSSIMSLRYLLVLNLSRTRLEKLPSSLGDLYNLVMLNLDFCSQLLFLPKSLAKLSKLQHLTVRGVKDLWASNGRNVKPMLRVRCVLKDLKQLVALKHLCLESDSQKVLPKDFMKALKELRVLWLSFRNLVDLPEPASGDLEHLQDLYLNGCESLTSLPSSFGSVLNNLHSLTVVFCDGLQSLPALDGLEKLLRLELICCSGLRSLPDSFGSPGAFPVLKELLLRICTAIASFPELQPGAMPRLMVLDFAECNQLVDIPEGMGNLTKLRRLGFQGCINLRSLENDSVGLQNLTDLEGLDVRSCDRISELPVSLAHLPKLRSIDMRECPASVPEQIENLAAEGRIELRRGLR